MKAQRPDGRVQNWSGVNTQYCVCRCGGKKKKKEALRKTCELQKTKKVRHDREFA